jgi:hypothetical protein
MDDRGVAIDLLRGLEPADRPKVIVVPRHRGPITSVMPASERSKVAADRLGHSLATLERLDCWRRR